MCIRRFIIWKILDYLCRQKDFNVSCWEFLWYKGLEKNQWQFLNLKKVSVDI